MVKKGRKDIHGVILVDKPQGLTSAAVVAIIKRQQQLAKVGHAGTLDPMATGLLPICINEGTKLAGLLSGRGKTYRTTMKLGVETDTQDCTGEETGGAAVQVSPEEVESQLRSFVGSFEQLPPMFSAKKKDGQPLYKMARKGVNVERKAVPVTLHQLWIHAIDLPQVEFSVHVSSGFYIRTLCHDLGRRLGCGGHMTALRRSGHGPFTLDGATGLDDLREMQAASFDPLVLGMASEKIDIPLINIGEEMTTAIRFGRPLTKGMAEESHGSLPPDAPELWRAVDPEGRVVALLRLAEAPELCTACSLDRVIWTIERGFVY